HRGRARPRSGAGDHVRDDAAVPRGARHRLARRAATARRLRPRRVGRRAARAGAAARGPDRARAHRLRRARRHRPGRGGHGTGRRRPRRRGARGPRGVSPDGERLQKILARAGIGSRRACEELIAAGRVRVNGAVAALGDRADPDADVIEVDGVRVGTRQGLVYYLLNKPRGVVSTASDPQGRPTVVDLVPSDPRVYPVGRLDADTEGLLLLTNDGDLAHRLTHPSYGVQKEY